MPEITLLVFKAAMNLKIADKRSKRTERPNSHYVGEVMDMFDIVVVTLADK